MLQLWQWLLSFKSFISQVRRRYNDFVSLNESLKISGIDLPLPPKRLLGNMEREFIAERQHGLQIMMDAILNHPMLAANVIVKKFLDTINYNRNLSGILNLLLV